MRSRFQRRRRGFTMTEVLVVVAIIAVLVSVAIPAFASQASTAQLAADHANVRAAYALVQAAQLSGEVAIDGQTFTLAEAFQRYHTGGNSHVAMVYLAADGSITADPSRAYFFQATGAPGGSPCQVCDAMGGARFHIQNVPIFIEINEDMDIYVGYTL